jgi:DNA topoisomerase-1
LAHLEEIQFKIETAKKWLKSKDITAQSRLKFEALLAGYMKELAHAKPKPVETVKAVKPNQTIWDCPLCDGKLVRRKNTKSVKYFLGCSNFPKCAYTQEEEPAGE